MKFIKENKGLIISILLALITVVLVHNYISALEERAAEDKEKKFQQTKEVVVLEQDIEVGTILSTEVLTLKEKPKNLVHPEAVTNIDDARGKKVYHNMLAGEVLLTPNLHEEDDTSKLSFSIPDGKRAITISVNQVSGVAGFVQAGDSVDVVVTASGSDIDPDGADKETPDKSKIILSNAYVLAVGENIPQEKQERVQGVETVTLSVTPSKSELLTIADEIGEIRLLLRATGDNIHYRGQEIDLGEVF